MTTFQSQKKHKDYYLSVSSVIHIIVHHLVDYLCYHLSYNPFSQLFGHTINMVLKVLFILPILAKSEIKTARVGMQASVFITVCETLKDFVAQTSTTVQL